MRLSSILLAGLLAGANAFAAYDKSFFLAEFWSGEWPPGISVVKRGLSVKGRTAMDLDAEPNIDCVLPYRATLNPWNAKGNKKRSAQYWTASKIVNLTALQDFELVELRGTKKVKVKAGETVSWMIYGGEGAWTAGYKGKTYYADQETLTFLSELKQEDTREDMWLKLKCANGRKAWLFFNDLVKTDKDGNSEFLDGLVHGGIGSGGVDFGTARDLTEKEAREARGEN